MMRAHRTGAGLVNEFGDLEVAYDAYAKLNDAKLNVAPAAAPKSILFLPSPPPHGISTSWPRRRRDPPPRTASTEWRRRAGIGLVRGRRVAVGTRGARGAAGSGRRPRRHGHHERGRHGLQRGVEGFIFRRRRPSVHLARRSWRCYVLEEDAASTSDFEVGRARRSPSSRARSSCRSLWLPATCSAGRWGRRSAVGRRRRRCDRRSPVADADRRSPVADVTVVRVYILLDL